MRLVYGRSQEVCDLVSGLSHGRPWNSGKGIGVARGRKLVGGFVFSEWSPEEGTIEVSAAAKDPRWLTRDVVSAVMAYPFDQIGVQLVWARTVLPHVVRICTAIGAEAHEIPRLGGRDKSKTILTLTAEAWRASRFSEVKHGRS